MLLPAPLANKAGSDDPTAWMDHAATPDGLIRLGLANGSITDFSTDGVGFNRIDPARPQLAGLDYLALGDWHGTRRVGPRCWYAGTPEPDRAGGGQERGQALLVEIDHAGATPVVTSLPTGTYEWLSMDVHITTEESLADLEARINDLPTPTRTVIHLNLHGAVSLVVRRKAARMVDRLAAGLLYLDVADHALLARPSESDLALMNIQGMLGDVAARLRAAALDESTDEAQRRVAADALVELFIRFRISATSKDRAATATPTAAPMPPRPVIPDVKFSFGQGTSPPIAPRNVHLQPTTIQPRQGVAL
jgi:hypothetical protein